MLSLGLGDRRPPKPGPDPDTLSGPEETQPDRSVRTDGAIAGEDGRSARRERDAAVWGGLGRFRERANAWARGWGTEVSVLAGRTPKPEALHVTAASSFASNEVKGVRSHSSGWRKRRGAGENGRWHPRDLGPTRAPPTTSRVNGLPRLWEPRFSHLQTGRVTKRLRPTPCPTDPQGVSGAAGRTEPCSTQVCPLLACHRFNLQIRHRKRQATANNGNAVARTVVKNYCSVPPRTPSFPTLLPLVAMGGDTPPRR